MTIGNHASESVQPQPTKTISTTGKKNVSQKRGNQQKSKAATSTTLQGLGKSGLAIGNVAKGSRTQSALSGGWSNPDTEMSSYQAVPIPPAEIPPPPPRTVTPVPDKSTFMRAAQFLLKVNAFQVKSSIQHKGNIAVNGNSKKEINIRMSQTPV